MQPGSRQHLGARIVSGGVSAEDLTVDALCVRELSAKIGFMADLAAQTCGTSQTRGGAPQWLLSPAFHRIAAS